MADSHMCRDEMLQLSGWDTQILNDLIEKRPQSGNTCITSVITVQYALLYTEIQERGMPVTASLEACLRAANPGFDPPKKWSNVTRSVLNNIKKGVKLQDIVFKINEKSENNFNGPACQNIGITKDVILGSHAPCHFTLTNACVHELAIFQQKYGNCWHDLRNWINRLLPVDSKKLTTDKIRYITKKIKDTYQDKMKNRQKFDLEMFKDTLFFKYINSIRPQTNVHVSDEKVKNKKLSSICKKLVNDQRDLHQVNENLNFENAVLRDTIQQERDHVNRLEATLEENNDNIEKLQIIKEKHQTLKRDNVDLKQQLTSLKKENYTKRLNRQKKMLNQKQEKMYGKEIKWKSKVKNLKKKVKNLDKHLEDLRILYKKKNS
ncbi:uncharacterized protein MCAP_0864-like [Argopecten irradians]|uniref:uncharacterized protein MCAP_0864-like n=1 Tax=Argopecten irradians TaxID=31199 RepID=UPI003713090C